MKQKKALPQYLSEKPAAQLNWGALDDFLNEPPPQAEPEPTGIGGRLKDAGISLLKGAIAVPESAVGVADLVTGGRAGQAAEAIGFRPKEAREILDQSLSAEQQAANTEVQSAEGFVATAAAALRNPSTIAHAVIESAPSLLPAGAVARGAMKIAPKLGGAIAAGLGEGVVSAGQTAEQVRQATADGLLTGEQAAIAGGSGALTGVLGAVAGKVANRLGIGDINQLVAGVRNAPPEVKKGVVRSIVEGFASEGLLQELPQSAQEQVAQNLALGKPWDEGVGNAAAIGALAGGAMGGAVAPINSAAPTAADQMRASKTGGDGVYAKGLDSGIEAHALSLEGEADIARRAAAARAAAAPVEAPPAPDWQTAEGAAMPAPEGSIEFEPTAVINTDGLALGDANEIAQANIAAMASRHEPMTIEEAQRITTAGREQGHDFEIVSHPSGGYWVAPRKLVTQQLVDAATAEPMAQPSAGALALEGDPLAAPPAVPALTYDTAQTGTMIADEEGGVRPEIRAEVINRVQDQAQRKASGLTPDVERATMRAATGTMTQPGDILTAAGFPFRSREVAMLAARRAGAGHQAVQIAPESFVVRQIPTDINEQDTPPGPGPAAPTEAAQQAVEDQGSLAPAGEGAGPAAPAGPAAVSADGLSDGAIFLSKSRATRAANMAPGSIVEKVEGGWVLRKETGDAGIDDRGSRAAGPADASAVDAAGSMGAERDGRAASAGAGTGAEVGAVPDGAMGGNDAALKRVTGKAIDKDWTAFTPESGTLGIPRADMPQIKAEHRGAMVNFLAARGITHEAGEMAAGDLKPSQAEFSPAKVDGAKSFTGGDRSILVSSDGHVLDGHHQWLAKLSDNEPVKVITLDAPIDKLIAEVKEFPSAETADGSTVAPAKQPASTEVALKRGAPGSGGMKAADLDSEIKPMASRWKNGPSGGVHVVQSVGDLPAGLGEQIKSLDAEDTVRAMFMPSSSTVYVVADNVRSVEEAQFALLHEVFGHQGLRAVLGAKYSEVMDRMRDANKWLAGEATLWFLANGEAEIAARVSNGMKPGPARRAVQLLAVEEALADRAGRNEPIGSWRFFVAQLQKGLRAIGLDKVADWMENRTQAEVMNLLRQARNAVKSGVKAKPAKAVESPGSTQPVLSRKTEGEPFDIKGKSAGALAHYRGMGMQALGRRQIVELFSKDLPALEAYNELVQRMDAEKNDTGAAADELATRWAKLKDEKQLADLMHDATIAQIDPSQPHVPGDELEKWQALNTAFKGLSIEARKVFEESRDFYTEHYSKVQEAIRDRLVRSQMNERARNRLLEQMEETFKERTKGFYAPLARFGSYVVLVRDAAGKVIGVSRAETVNEAEATRARLVKDYPAAKVSKVTKDPKFDQASDSPGAGFMKELFAVIEGQGADDALRDAVSQLYLSSLPDLSWAKHGIHRKGTPGFSSDARRAFAQSAFHGARYLAKLRHADKLQAELDLMAEQVDVGKEDPKVDSILAQQVLDEMKARHKSLMNPQSNPLSTALTSAGFVFHLGLSPASAAVNVSQTALVAYPIMGAKWGFAKAGAALMRASKEAIASKNDMSKVLKGDELKAYNEAVSAGVIDVTQAHDLAGVAQGEDSNLSWKLRPVMKWAGFLFHHAERFNRAATFVASYRLAREAGGDHARALREATKATYDGHFDYSASNRPRVMQGNIARVVLLFKQFGQNMLYTITRQAYLAAKGMDPKERAEARKALSGLLVMHAAGAGSLGLPFVTTLLAAASMIGSTDDEPWDAQTALQNMLADAFGTKAAEVMAHGLSRLTPWDISGRVGLDKLILPDVQEGLEGQRLAESAALAALGPVGGIATGLLKGMQTMSEGKYSRGLEEMLPASLRGPMKAARFAMEGSVDKTGVTILDDVSPAAIVGQAVGFTPSEVKNASEGKSAVLELDRALQDRRKALKRQYTMAMEAGDQEAIAEARAAIAKFSEKNPDRRITSPQLAASMRERLKRERQAEHGIYLPRNRRDAMEAGRFAFAGEDESE